jgi:hypothetical protein
MPTATRTPGRRAPAQSRRRAPTQSRYARAAAHRGQGLRRRKPPKPTGIKKVLGAAGSVLPGAAAKKAAPSSKKGKAGGLALAAAAAGMAFKNRDKLGQLRHKDEGAPTGTTTPESNHTATVPPATPTV